MEKDLFFSDGSKGFVEPQTVHSGENVTISFRTPKDLKAAPVIGFFSKDKEVQMKYKCTDVHADIYEIKVKVPDTIMKYYFKFSYNGRLFEYDRRGVVEKAEERYMLTIIPDFYVPDWSEGCVMYQIFVDRFKSGNKKNDVESGEYIYADKPVEHMESWYSTVRPQDVGRFFGGDLNGVLQKLDYLKDLGIEAIYFSPIFVSPSNHKYDGQDYDHVDPHLAMIVKDAEKGANDLTRYAVRTTAPENLKASDDFFARFVEEAHKRGIRVIIDGVFNHCGSYHKWMNREGLYKEEDGYQKGAFESKDSPYRNFFKFKNEDDPESYEKWWGFDTLPKLNYEGSDELCKYVYKIGAKWVSEPFNVDGWRLDVAADLGHSEEFNHYFWKNFRHSVRNANKDALILAEHYGDPSEWLKGDEWDTVMNYDAFMEPITWFLTGMEKHSDSFNGDALNNEEMFLQKMSYSMAMFGQKSLNAAMNELSNHDHSRFYTRTNRKVGRLESLGSNAASEGVDKAVFLEAVVMQMTWPGAPTVYYGDEVGLCGFTDPDNRRPYPWGNEDTEILKAHKDLIKIHRTFDVFKHGSFAMVHSEHGIIAYTRFDKRDKILVCVNNNDHERTVTINIDKLNMKEEAFVSLYISEPWHFAPEARIYDVFDGELTIHMRAHSAYILKNFER